MERQIVHVGRKIQVAVETHVTANGEAVLRDVVLHPGAVVVLPVLDDDHVVLLRNYRFVVGERLWEAPAGTLEPKETLESCARRELQEETGYTAAEWQYLGYLYASPGVLNEKLHLFIARGLSAGEASPEPGEDLEPVILPLTRAMAMIDEGEIKDAKTVTLLLRWERLRQRSSVSAPLTEGS